MSTQRVKKKKEAQTTAYAKLVGATSVNSNFVAYLHNLKATLGRSYSGSKYDDDVDIQLGFHKSMFVFLFFSQLFPFLVVWLSDPPIFFLSDLAFIVRSDTIRKPLDSSFLV
jgi:hypothetical protein